MASSAENHIKEDNEELQQLSDACNPCDSNDYSNQQQNHLLEANSFQVKKTSAVGTVQPNSIFRNMLVGNDISSDKLGKRNWVEMLQTADTMVPKTHHTHASSHQLNDTNPSQYFSGNKTRMRQLLQSTNCTGPSPGTGGESKDTFDDVMDLTDDSEDESMSLHTELSIHQLNLPNSSKGSSQSGHAENALGGLSQDTSSCPETNRNATSAMQQGNIGANLSQDTIGGGQWEEDLLCDLVDLTSDTVSQGEDANEQTNNSQGLSTAGCGENIPDKTAQPASGTVELDDVVNQLPDNLETLVKNTNPAALMPIMTHVIGKECLPRCKLCGTVVEGPCRLKVHMRVHTGEKPYQCKFCDRKFRLTNSLKVHERGHKGEWPQCPVCGGRYRAIEGHMLIHATEKKYTCSVCNRSFSKQSYLKRHVLVHSTEKPYTCQDCGGGFRSIEYLRRHMVVHTNLKTHVCPTCGKLFSSSTSLVAHSHSHGDKHPYQCETCGRGFHLIAKLERHKTSHSSERRFSCGTCGKQYKWPYAVRRHELTHTGEQPYECSECGMKFNQSCSRDRHMLTHTGVKPYSCSDCGLRFTQSGGLCSHRRKHCPKLKNAQN